MQPVTGNWPLSLPVFLSCLPTGCALGGLYAHRFGRRTCFRHAGGLCALGDLAGGQLGHGVGFWDRDSVSIRARHCWRANRLRPQRLARAVAVSIRARHCWRANPHGAHKVGHLDLVSIRARHCWRANRAWWVQAQRYGLVSIRARHCWRANRPALQQVREPCTFQSAPAIAGGRIDGSGGSEAPGAVVSIRARHCWRANRILPGSKRIDPWFQSAPAIAGGRIYRRSCSALAPASFNPRPPLLAGESPSTRPTSSRVCFNPRPPLLAGESAPAPLALQATSCFNPRPPLLAGESAKDCMRASTAVFQSAPAIAGGRICAGSSQAAGAIGFNPRPPLLAGESCSHSACCVAWQVSIRARHCWRANQSPRDRLCGSLRFQSAPAIAGGRITSHANLCWSTIFSSTSANVTME